MKDYLKQQSEPVDLQLQYVRKIDTSHNEKVPTEPPKKDRHTVARCNITKCEANERVYTNQISLTGD